MVDALLTISEFCIVRIRACPAYAFQLIYHCHILLGYLKIKKLQILLNPHRGNGFGQRKMSFLQAPPQTDLGCGPAVFLSKLLQLWIFQKLSGTKGDVYKRQNLIRKLIALNYHRRILFTEIFSYTLFIYNVK